ncbi:MAG: hypothetical protein IPK65_06390 [Gammaproteobacteria bacterium]|nr:hypothetical protein [Gammaproteobacteria bacterium]
MEKIEPGMVLLEDVVHMNGRILMRAGSEITDKNLRILKTWGILTVNITQDAQAVAGADDTPAADPEQIRAVEEGLRDLFRHADLSHPALAELYRHRVRQALDGTEREG